MKVPLLKKLQIENKILRNNFNNVVPSVTGEGEDVVLENTANAKFKKFKILGNSKQEGEPSVEAPIENKSCGDDINLFDGTFEKGNLNGSTGADEHLSDKYIYTKNYIQVKPSSNLKIKVFTNSELGNNHRIVEYDESKKLVNCTWHGTQEFNQKLRNNTKYVRFSVNFVNSEDVNLTTKTKVTQDVTINEYSPYGQGSISLTVSDSVEQNNSNTIPTQKPFGKIAEYNDTFAFQNNKWYEKHLIGSYIFTGDENINRLNVDTTPYGYFFQIDNLLPKKIKYIDNTSPAKYAINSHFQMVNNGHSEMNNSCMSIGRSGTNPFFFLAETYTTKEQVKEFFKNQYENGSPVKLDYVLDEPELIECTKEQTKALNQIQELNSYKGITHISSNDEISPVFDVEACMNIQKIINDMQKEINELKGLKTADEVQNDLDLQ